MARRKLDVSCITFHIAAVIYHLFIMYYVNFQLDLSRSTNKYVTNLARFSWRFFTTWNFVVQSYYFIICVTDDALEMFTGTEEVITVKKQVRRVRNYTFRTFAFPLAFTVSIMFWILFTVDRSLVFPMEIDRVLPSWVNHALHTNIVMFILLEQFITFHWYPAVRKQAIAGLTIYNLVYFVCYMSTYVIHGVWLYPVHEITNWTQRVLLGGFMYMMTYGFYMLGEGMNSKIWENEIQKINGMRSHHTPKKIY